MPTRLRKTRKLRGGRHMGWGQVGQHRASGHKCGLGRSGHLKHLWSTVIKEDQDHFGHESTHRPVSVAIITKKWINVRDLDDLFAKSGKSENYKNVLYFFEQAVLLLHQIFLLFLEQYLTHILL